jgi:hypothetical protein
LLPFANLACEGMRLQRLTLAKIKPCNVTSSRNRLTRRRARNPRQGDSACNLRYFPPLYWSALGLARGPVATVASLDLATGEVNFVGWFRAQVEESVNAATPVVVDDFVLISSAYYRLGSATTGSTRSGRRAGKQQAGSASAYSNRSTLTNTGTFAGSKAYVSPGSPTQSSALSIIRS